jgi:hypothetical protein
MSRRRDRLRQESLSPQTGLTLQRERALPGDAVEIVYRVDAEAKAVAGTRPWMLAGVAALTAERPVGPARTGPTGFMVGLRPGAR